MPAFTPFLNLYKPGGGSTGLITPDEAADIDRLNENFDLIDSFAQEQGDPDTRNRAFYGPAAGISSVTDMKIGDTYQESDGDRMVWRYNGSAWKIYYSGWKPVTMTSPWTSAENYPVRVRAHAGQIHLNGVIAWATGASYTDVCVIPEGFRPVPVPGYGMYVGVSVVTPAYADGGAFFISTVVTTEGKLSLDVVYGSGTASPSAAALHGSWFNS